MLINYSIAGDTAFIYYSHMNILNIFRPQKKLSKEAFEAYFNRLPDSIEVSWFRDGNFIVGKVKAGDNEFMTQGMSGDDFIEVVNDAVIAVNKIPRQYIDVVRKSRAYNPPIEEKKKLEDINIKNSVISLPKDDKILQSA